MKKALLLNTVLVIALSSCTENKSCNAADIVFINTSVYTGNESNPKAEALTILGDTINFVGSSDLAKDYQCGQAKVVDLSSSYVYPGFVDSHAHLKGIGYRENSLNLQGINSLKEMLTTVEIFANNIASGEWIVGRGWIEKSLARKEIPN